jgi:hypothetical protein
MQTQPPPIIHYEQQLAMRDNEHIKLLTIFHYVMSGLYTLGACLSSLYVLMAFFFMRIPMTPPPGSGRTGPTPQDLKMLEMMSWMWGIMGGIGGLISISMAIASFMSGKYLSSRTRPTFIFIVACIQCIAFPMGTALGIFTILVLQRPSVRNSFGQPPQPAAY